MSGRPPEDIGPDPHLNQRGVALSRQQRRTLGVTALVIGAGLVLVLVGLMNGAPPGWSAGAREPADPYRIVLSGPSRALVSVEQDGGALPEAEVALPWLVPVDPGTGVVSVRARPVGGQGSAAIRCTVRNAADDSVAEVRTADGSGVVRCGAALR